MQIGVVGGSGYAGRELLRLLAHHPAKPQVIEIDRTHVLEEASACDVAMLATPAEVSHELVPKLLAAPVRVIDLSGAFRLRNAAAYATHYAFSHAHPALLAEAVYGLPELDRKRIATARLVANPGCYATAIQLALAPLFAPAGSERGVAATESRHVDTTRDHATDNAPPRSEALVTGRTLPRSEALVTGRSPSRSDALDSGRTPPRSDALDTGRTPALERSDAARSEALVTGRIIVDAMSGVTGAGRKPTPELSFAEIAGDLRAYRVLRHQHEPEIEQGLGVDITFVPHLLPVQRGILATCHAQLAPGRTRADVAAAFERAYAHERFIALASSPEEVSLHDVVGTNICRIGFAVEGEQLVVIAAIDNLVKGAAGQAVQNLNLMLGWPEQAGLAELRSFYR